MKAMLRALPVLVALVVLAVWHNVHQPPPVPPDRSQSLTRPKRPLPLRATFNFSACGRLWLPGNESDVPKTPPASEQRRSFPTMREELVEDVHFLYIIVSQALEDMGIEFVLARETLLATIRHLGPAPWDPYAQIWVDGREPAALRQTLANLGGYTFRETDNTIYFTYRGTVQTDAYIVLALYVRNNTHLLIHNPQSQLEFGVPLDAVFPLQARPYGCVTSAPIPNNISAILEGHYGRDLSWCSRPDLGTNTRRTLFPCAEMMGHTPFVFHDRNASLDPFEHLMVGGEQLFEVGPGQSHPSPIPRELHFFSAGSVTVPAAMESCFLAYPGWRVHIWNNHTLPFRLTTKTAFDKYLRDPQQWHLAALLALLEVVRAYGGLAVTDNFDCGVPLPDGMLEAGYLLTAFKSTAQRLDAVVVAAPAHAHIHKLLVDLATQGRPDELLRAGTSFSDSDDWHPLDDTNFVYYAKRPPKPAPAWLLAMKEGGRVIIKGDPQVVPPPKTAMVEPSASTAGVPQSSPFNHRSTRNGESER